MHHWGMTNDKIRQGGNQSKVQIRRGLVVFVTLQKQLAENANRFFHVYIMIVVIHIYNKSVAIRFAGHPGNKNKSLVVRLF